MSGGLMTPESDTVDNKDTKIFERYTFTLPPDLVRNVEAFGQSKQMNRSQVVREALANWLSTQEELEERALSHPNQTGVATITYTYDHHDGRVLQDLLDAQHQSEELIVSTTHIHLSHTICFEVVVCRGPLGTLKGINALASAIRVIKGINGFAVLYSPL